jgi:tRNA (adenine57-N1/adenine58-N1)-methyltransferase
VDSDAPLAEGETVLLRRRTGDAFLARLEPGPRTLEGRGVIDLSPLVGRAPGAELEWAGARYRAFRPGLPDLLAQVRRRAQIVQPKDAMQLLYLAGVGPGGRVAEAGAGSGALTLVLAHAVGAEGRVVAYDRREDFLDIARRNVAVGDFAQRVQFRRRDVVEEGFDVGPVDSVVLDLPEPWAALPRVRDSLRLGGRVGIYTPTYNQLERSVRSLRELGFEEIRSSEILERGIHVGEGGTRPDFDMLAHTGFLTGARRVE